jgi:hypothetical protein
VSDERRCPDVSLTTNRAGGALTFSHVERFEGEHGFSTLLLIESAPFVVQVPFCFETYPLRVFVEQLEEMDHTVAGSARLQMMWEKPHLEFRLDARGHVTVRGVFLFTEQRLDFDFVTDQMCLRRLC